MFAKLSALIKNTAGRAMNKSTMVATCHGMGRMIYADGVVEDAELAAAMAIAKANPKLNAFGGDFNRELDRVLDSWETSKRQARVASNRAIQDWAGTASPEDREDFLIAVLDLMESDGDTAPEELAVARELAGFVGLNVENFL